MGLKVDHTRKFLSTLDPSLSDERLQELIPHFADAVENAALVPPCDLSKAMAAIKRLEATHLSPREPVQFLADFSYFFVLKKDIVLFLGRSSPLYGEEMRKAQLESLDATKKVSENRCFYCNKTENLKLCGRCRIMKYCSEEHQKIDWPKHKVECGFAIALPQLFARERS